MVGPDGDLDVRARVCTVKIVCSHCTTYLSGNITLKNSKSVNTL